MSFARTRNWQLATLPITQSSPVPNSPCKPPFSPLKPCTSGDCRMKFNLIDRIEQVSDERLVAVKNVSLAEEYLGDHFPTFPVLPGVLMLEALVQAAGWLLHRKSGFSKSIAVLKEARNVKYGTFVAPGNSLRVDVEVLKFTEG